MQRAWKSSSVSTRSMKRKSTFLAIARTSDLREPPPSARGAATRGGRVSHRGQHGRGRNSNLRDAGRSYRDLSKLSTTCLIWAMVLPLLLCALAPAGLLEQLPPQVGSAADMEQMHSYLSAGSPRPLAAQMPGRPAAAATPAEPMTPATDLQGALRMSMGSLMGFCRCEGGAPCQTPAARASPRASSPLPSPLSLPAWPTCAPGVQRARACSAI